jgi:isopenicillin-N epimerase
VSHGANTRIADRSRFRLEFDWTGTPDPTAYLSLPTAIDWMATLPGGWTGVMAANHELLLDGRDRLAAGLGIDPPAPDSMLGSMAALPLPGVPDEDAARALGRRLLDEHRIQVPLGLWPVRAARGDDIEPRMLIRISAQRYNEPADYDRLVEALKTLLS